MNQSSRFYYNRSKRDIVISDLNLTVRSGQVIDIFSLNQELNMTAVMRSEYSGGLKRAMQSGGLLRLDGPPAKNYEQITPKYNVSNAPTMSRVKSNLHIDKNTKFFVDELEEDFLSDSISDEKLAETNEKFISEVDLEGFSDPLKEE